jgi:hypothetical protein
MPSRYSDATNRRQRAYEHGTERSEFLDTTQIIARNYAQIKVRGTNKTKCGRCGGYYTKEQKDLHEQCPIAQIPPPISKKFIEQETNKKTAAKSHSNPKQQRPSARRQKNPFQYSGNISIFRVSVDILSNGQTTRTRLGIWSCRHNDASLLFKDEELLKSLAIKLRSRYNPSTTTIASASAQNKKTGETYPLNSSRLSELFQNGKSSGARGQEGVG